MNGGSIAEAKVAIHRLTGRNERLGATLAAVERALDAIGAPPADSVVARVEAMGDLMAESLAVSVENADTRRALDEVGAPPWASPAERVRALVREPEPKHGRWISIVGENDDREIEHHAKRQDAEGHAREWYKDALADTGEGRDDFGLVALIVSLVDEETRPAGEDDPDEYDYIITGYDVRRLDGAATVQAGEPDDAAEAAQAARIAARVAARLPDHAPALRVAVADLAAALGEDAPDTAGLGAAGLSLVVAGLAARVRGGGR